jgi:hypothetical protein
MLVWQESGASDLSAPSTVGFGTRLIDTNVKVELRGDIRREFLLHGLRIDIAIPVGTRQARHTTADRVRRAGAGAASSRAAARRPGKSEPRGARPAD